MSARFEDPSAHTRPALAEEEGSSGWNASFLAVVALRIEFFLRFISVLAAAANPRARVLFHWPTAVEVSLRSGQMKHVRRKGPGLLSSECCGAPVDATVGWVKKIEGAMPSGPRPAEVLSLVRQSMYGDFCGSVPVRVLPPQKDSSPAAHIYSSSHKVLNIQVLDYKI
jgi:hypothetical protein